MIFASSTRELSPSERVIHRLYEITANFEAGFDEQVEDLLDMGRERFELDIGIVSEIEAERDLYRVVGTRAPDGIDLRIGDEFSFARTYCSITLGAHGPVGFGRAGEAEVAHHPAYGDLELESYFGIPIYSGPFLYGTLSFSSATPRERAFDEIDVDCLRLMGSWLSSELHRRAIESELYAAQASLERLVRTDPLTELSNRRGIREIFERHAERSGFDGAQLSCILVDIDDFKQVNDRLGHSAGDVVIQAVADAIRASVRPSDTPGRIGGDEFLVVLPGASLAEAERAAQRIAGNVSALRFKHEEEKVSVTVSIGVSKVPHGVTTVTDVLTETQDLLRESKAAGKNTVSVSRKVDPKSAPPRPGRSSRSA